MLPPPSTATPVGNLNAALVAGPPSPLKPAMPMPASVVMTPEVTFTRRMRWLDLSAMSTLPHPSATAPYGDLKPALVAGPPSPLKPPVPVPASVVISPVPTATRRMR